MPRIFPFVLFLFPAFLSAQPYLNQTSTWRYRGGASGFDGTVEFLDHRFYLDGDTAIAGKTYFKLYFDRQDTTFSWATGGGIVGLDTTLHTYHGAIREEAKRFYMVFSYETEENPTQDFNLALGDTIQWSGCWWEVITVTAVDTVYLGPTPLKRFFLNEFTDEFILEGACGTSGFRVGCPGAVGIEYNLDPVCYGRDGHSVSFVAGQAECSVGASATQAPQVRRLPLSPNPSDGLVRLTLPFEAAVVRVFNAWGTEVLLKTGLSAGPALDLSALSDGIYFIAAQDGAATYLGKVVLIK